MNRTDWLNRLANLNVARTQARGIAPHKPLMLLTVIDLIDSGDIPDGWVKYDVRLVSRFRDYWELVLERQRNNPEIPMPFRVHADEVKGAPRPGRDHLGVVVDALGDLDGDPVSGDLLHRGHQSCGFWVIHGF